MINDLKEIHEECGVFGVFQHPNAANLCYYGLHALQHRGQEGAGILVANDHQLSIHKGERIWSLKFLTVKRFIYDEWHSRYWSCALFNCRWWRYYECTAFTF